MRPLGIYMARVFNGEYNFLRPVENLIYRISGVRRDEEMTWREYAAAMLLFSFASLRAHLPHRADRSTFFPGIRSTCPESWLRISPGTPPPPSPRTPTGRPTRPKPP